MTSDDPRRPAPLPGPASFKPAAPAAMSARDAHRAFLLAACALHGALARGLAGRVPEAALADAVMDVAEIIRAAAQPGGALAVGAALADRAEAER